MNLKYGKGKVILDVNMDIYSAHITYRGNPYIIFKRKYDKHKLVHKKNNIFISGKDIKGDLFKYFGYLRIVKCVCVSNTYKKLNINVKTMNIHFPELMDQYPEDISSFPEKLHQGYVMIKRFKGKQYKEPKPIGLNRSRRLRQRGRRTARGGY